MSSLVENKQCNVCKAVKKNDALRRRIDKSKAYVPSSKDTLAKIAKDHKDEFAYNSLLRHCKNHQFPNAKEIKEAEVAAVQKKRQRNYQDVWDNVIEKGMEELESGNLKIQNVNQLLLAARDKSNFEKQSKDQSLALMEMVFRFSAGEVGLPNGENRQVLKSEAGSSVDADESGTDTESLPLGPRDFYQSLAGDAAPRRTGEVLEGSDGQTNED